MSLTAAERRRSERWRDIALYAIVVIVTMASFWALIRIHQSGEAVHQSRAIVLGLLRGEAEWRAFQNRLLSPALVMAITQLGYSIETAIGVFHFTCLLAESLLLTELLRRLGLKRRQVLLYTAGLLFGFLILQDAHFLYVWDGVDLIVFTLLAFAATNRPARLWPLLVLFAVELLNRESALFISLYIAMLGLGYEAAPRRIVIRDWKIVALGLGLTAAGALYTKLLRDLLFAHAAADPRHELLGNHFVLLYNFMARPALLISLALVIAVVMLWQAMRPLDERRLRFMAIFTALVAGGLVFGMSNETRTLFVLIPFFLFSTLLLPETKAEA